MSGEKDAGKRLTNGWALPREPQRFGGGREKGKMAGERPSSELHCRGSSAEEREGDTSERPAAIGSAQSV